MAKVEDITKNQPHVNVWALCLHPRFNGASTVTYCHKKWISVCPVGTNLFTLECPLCGAQNSFPSVIPLDLPTNPRPVFGG